ncbi:MAG: ankyrin repeat domain-containing protein, partial [Spirochaetaceae bacterium]|nr:ankyrin repeat domain-containing protein [Spirochaetaceae bacterium]
MKKRRIFTIITASILILTMFPSCVSGAIAGVMAPTVAAFVASGIIGIGDVPEKVPEEPTPPPPKEDDSHPVPTLQGDPIARNSNSDAEIFTNPQTDNSDDDFVYEDDDDFFYETDDNQSSSTSSSSTSSAAVAKTNNSDKKTNAGSSDLQSQFKPSTKGTDSASTTGTNPSKTTGTATAAATTPVNTEKYTSDWNVINLILAGRAEEAKQELDRTKAYNQTDSNGYSSLHAAAMANNAELVTWLIDRGADTEQKNILGDTPAFTAIRYYSANAAQALVDGGADYFATNSEGKMAFSAGIEKDKSFYPVFIIQPVGEVRDIRGQTIVHYFIKNDDIDGAALCIERDLNLDIRDNNGLTPLALAYTNTESPTSAALAAALILAGVSPIRGDFEYFENTVKTRNARQTFEDDQTALHLAVVRNHYGIADYLISCGSLLDAQDISGATPLHLAVRYGRLNHAKLLLEKGANVNACDSTLKTPLLITAPKEAQDDIYTLLLEHKADTSAQDIFGDNALQVATFGGMSSTLVIRLINAGARVNAANKKGLTPLAQAVALKNVEHIKIYSTHGADIFAADINGESPLTRCLRDGNILKILVNASNLKVTDAYGNTPLHIALERKATAGSVRYLLDAGIAVDVANCYGETPLFSATKSDNYQGVQQLIKAGAIKNITDNQGNTALHACVRWAAEKSCAKLLAAGYDVDIKNQSGKTPLAEAARQNRIEIMKQLISKGANINSQDVTGKSILMDAIQCKNPVAASLLLQKGADPTIVDVYGRNAFHEATTTEIEEIISLIQKTGVSPLSS